MLARLFMCANILAAEKRSVSMIMSFGGSACRYLDYIMFNLKFSEIFVIPFNTIPVLSIHQ